MRLYMKKNNKLFKQANNKAISIRYEAVKADKATGCLSHQLRTGRIPGYVEQDKISENTVMIFRKTDTQKMRKELIASRQAKGQTALRKDAKIFIDSIITFGTSAQEKLEKLSKEEQDRMFLKVARDQQEEHGHELLQLVVHRDEQALHAHCLFRASRIENDKEKSWTYNKKHLSRFQDIAGESVKHLGIQRGHRKKDRLEAGASWKEVTHKSVKQLHIEMRKDSQRAKELRKIRERMEKQPKPKAPAPVEKRVLSWKFPYVEKVSMIPEAEAKKYQKQLKDWEINKVAHEAVLHTETRKKLRQLILNNEQQAEELEEQTESMKMRTEYAHDVVEKIVQAFGVTPEDVQKLLREEIAQEEFLKLAEKQNEQAIKDDFQMG